MDIFLYVHVGALKCQLQRRDEELVSTVRSTYVSTAVSFTAKRRTANEEVEKRRREKQQSAVVIEGCTESVYEHGKEKNTIIEQR